MHARIQTIFPEGWGWGLGEDNFVFQKGGGFRGLFSGILLVCGFNKYEFSEGGSLDPRMSHY